MSEKSLLLSNIATERITWGEIKQIIGSRQLHKLRRSKDEALKYQAHKDNLAAKHVSMPEYLLNHHHWDAAELAELNEEKYPTDEQKTEHLFEDNSLYKVTKNDFPYFYELSVLHLLVWSKIEMPVYANDNTANDTSFTITNKFPDANEAVVNRIDQFLAKTLHSKYGMEKGRDYVWFVNYSHLQSVRAISHLHLLIKGKDEAAKEQITRELLEQNAFKPL
ncbi:Htc1p KNAG_0A02020 [Huiozyma naganishii CBS 8797]|uniref:Uncharacterized protein n=1 Tax=Huiozyma naganishii (strain ATCC MYA-139 / BCRC 22969 / CBS 8797 / KCTC 17520 / NBRC 10181 / NCYC 3082 / Yp74L-3) TaxID=1071383 RepID=J7S3A4_HUIN7|nr:hypothetical protein KNAG_0A02020 [Kazachstania naganishii CBS 8797]CCK67891.1 hypothetical protein KNAG_0A02020 [Kazachstania naganishii CBS 8797]